MHIPAAFNIAWSSGLYVKIELGLKDIHDMHNEFVLELKIDLLYAKKIRFFAKILIKNSLVLAF